MPEIIAEGNNVLLKKGKNLKLFQVHAKREVWVERTKFCLGGIIGHPFGTKFEVKNGQMVKVTKDVEAGFSQTESAIDKDNRNLHDLDSNQKLTRDEIEQMKKEGVTGDKLIEQIIENSATFQEKTGYAQEKYVRKKKQKHLLEYTVLKPNTRLLCEMYFNKAAPKICHLRMDSLSQMLTNGNIRPHCTVAVVETCMGLITGAVMERLGGFGKVIYLYPGDVPNTTAIDSYDFPSEVMNSLYYFPLDQVNSLNNEKSQCSNIQKSDIPESSNISSTNCVNEAELTTKSSQIEITDSNTGNSKIAASDSKITTEVLELAAEENGSEASNSEEGMEVVQSKRGSKRKEKEREKKERKEIRDKKQGEAKQILLKGGIDCLIVACKYHPTPIVTALMDYLAPSRQVIVYSQFKEALMDCYVYLRERGGLVNYRLTETWLREYQVLPQRTHPVIQMSGTGGYVFTATTIVK